MIARTNTECNGYNYTLNKARVVCIYWFEFISYDFNELLLYLFHVVTKELYFQSVRPFGY